MGLTLHSSLFMAKPGPGVSSEVEPPVPIPNTAVKRLSVDDTGGAVLWENRPMPGPSLLAASDQLSAVSIRYNADG